MITLMILGALALYLAIAFFVTKLLVRLGETKGTRWSIGVISALVFFLLPTWDEIAGRIYFNNLCNTVGGQQIIKTVELGNEFFLKPGEIDVNIAGRLPAKGGELNHEKLKEKFSIVTSSGSISKQFRIEKDVRVVKNLQTGELLATDTRLFYFKGWLLNSTGLHVSGEICPERTNQYYREFYASIFKRGAR